VPFLYAGKEKRGKATQGWTVAPPGRRGQWEDVAISDLSGGGKLSTKKRLTAAGCKKRGKSGEPEKKGSLPIRNLILRRSREHRETAQLSPVKRKITAFVDADHSSERRRAGPVFRSTPGKATEPPTPTRYAEGKDGVEVGGGTIFSMLSMRQVMEPR